MPSSWQSLSQAVVGSFNADSTHYHSQDGCLCLVNATTLNSERRRCLTVSDNEGDAFLVYEKTDNNVGCTTSWWFNQCKSSSIDHLLQMNSCLNSYALSDWSI